ncbi:hypothetical protein BN85411380 [Alteracholeplasma palmae J233]|uniref:Pycsar effector protein domain-containing protein n=1 Tax=Alteracholeplasma palmae (strain ATCC 49389 / J233) TaxID=1318466 RepID=U4KQK0_ALTPJ|nr:Pycsar system effector family protein [Alteracholeplasma palmae]CCV64715.1 hypothetical protein BN85411380 [Alteracholeplasma palmae J233]
MNDSNNDIREQKKISLDIVLNQISSFDSKASVVVSIMGIVFALSFTVIEIISDKADKVKPQIFIFFILFLISIITSLTFSVLVLFPKNRKGKTSKKSLTYYKDLRDIMSDDEYMMLFKDANDCGISIEQIKQNAIICSFKHLMLKISIIFMIPTVLFFLITTILLIWL